MLGRESSYGRSGAGVRWPCSGPAAAGDDCHGAAGLSRFADARGVPPGGEFLLDYDVIVAFCVPAWRAGRRRPGARTGRRCTGSPRRRTARRGSGRRRSRVGGAGAYSPAERAELAAVAAAQRDPAKRSSALAMVVSGIGAGLRPGELVALRGDDIVRHGGQVMVQVGGPPARVVPVTSRYASRAWELARRAGSGFVFRPGPADRSCKNFVTNFARGLAADPAAPAL